jgi:hypothetical protein
MTVLCGTPGSARPANGSYRRYLVARAGPAEGRLTTSSGPTAGPALSELAYPDARPRAQIVFVVVSDALEQDAAGQGRAKGLARKPIASLGAVGRAIPSASHPSTRNSRGHCRSNSDPPPRRLVWPPRSTLRGRMGPWAGFQAGRNSRGRAAKPGVRVSLGALGGDLCGRDQAGWVGGEPCRIRHRRDHLFGGSEASRSPCE